MVKLELHSFLLLHILPILLMLFTLFINQDSSISYAARDTVVSQRHRWLQPGCLRRWRDVVMVESVEPENPRFCNAVWAHEYFINRDVIRTRNRNT